MNYIQRLLLVTTDEKFNLRIRRENVLEDTLCSINRTAFSPYKTIVVCHSIGSCNLLMQGLGYTFYTV